MEKGMEKEKNMMNIDGKRWNGKGKEKNFEMEFEGEYLNGKYWNGKGKRFKRWSHGRSYNEVEIINGEMHVDEKDIWCE